MKSKTKRNMFFTINGWTKNYHSKHNILYTFNNWTFVLQNVIDFKISVQNIYCAYD